MMSGTDKTDTKSNPEPETRSSITASIDSAETRARILSELIKAEDYYVKKIHAAEHAMAHELMSDSSAIVGAVTTFNLVYFQSLIAVSPIVGMLFWERAQAKEDLKKLHRVAELFRKTRDPRYFHVLGLELEGIPKSDDLTREQKKKVESDIQEILDKPVSFGNSLKNLRSPAAAVQETGENLRRFSKAQLREIGKKLAVAGKEAGIFLLDTVKDLKNLRTLPLNYTKGGLVLVRQISEVAWLPLKDQFTDRVAKPLRGYFNRAAEKKPEIAEDFGVTIAKVKKSKTVTFTADPGALNREIKRIKESLRRAAIESTVNGVAFVCQTAFVVNQAYHSYELYAHDHTLAAVGVALPSILALSPLNYFAKNQIDKHNQMNSDRADRARRLEQYARTLESVEKVKRLIAKVHAEKDEETHLKMAHQLVGMFDGKFNPAWFDEKNRANLQTLFTLVADDSSEEESGAGQKKIPPSPEPDDAPAP